MDYSKLSDMQINAAVAICIWDTDMTAKSGEFDPCNNPADAWQIIQKNGISLTYDGFDWMAECIMGNASKYSCDIDQHPERPLRAAMIVFLMMQGDD